MALTEARVLKSVEILPASSAVNVLWADQVLRDGEVISESNHRKSYNANNKDSFLIEVEGAENYIPVLGWE
ncbi:MAG TPA: hypothetical protein VN030_11550 [Cellvibrio sp.]|nr:hypothetical protein [Cellvibrio sp.]